MPKPTLTEITKAILDKNWNGKFTESDSFHLSYQGSLETGLIALGLAHYDWNLSLIHI